MYKRILVTLDGSKLSEEVLPMVRAVTEVNKTDIVLLRVVEYPYTLYSLCYEYPPSDPDLAKTILNKKGVIHLEVTNYLERIASTLRLAGIKVTAEVHEGQVVESILSSADRLAVDLIMLSACGQSGGSHYAIGAIADRILREARVPVILVRPVTCSVIHDASLEYRIHLPV
jgi:nucleotide-binding universal stress UspA family protein